MTDRHAFRTCAMFAALFCFLLIAASPAELLGQEVQGTVIDSETEEPIPGVNVVVDETTIGTTTDLDGEYELELPSDDVVLVFSFVGYVTQEIPVDGREEIDVALEEDVAGLEEVMVVGYGTVERTDLTGSVDRMDAERLRDQSVTDVSEMLSGTIAGFNATQGTSASGGASFEVRGQNSLSAGTEPMIVLDGMIFNGNLRDINPNDVESIDVLKDASSAAVYGARAASGVVLITTTRGEAGTPTVNFDSRMGVAETTTDHYKWRGPEDYIQMRQDFYRSQHLDRPNYYWNHPDDLPDGVTQEEWHELNPSPLSDPEEEWISRMNFFPLEAELYREGETFDWGEFLYPRAVRQEVDLSISGGTDDVQYYWSAGYTDNEGVRLGDQFSAIRTRLNLDFEPIDWLSLGVNAQYANRDESSITAGFGYTMSPFSRLYDEEGNVEWYPHGYSVATSPVVNTLSADRDRKLNSMFGEAFGEVSLPYGIAHRVAFQPRYEFIRDYQFWGPETITGGRNVEGGRADRTDAQEFDWMLTNMMTWDREVGIHHFDVTLVHEVEELRTRNSFMQNTTFRPSPVLGYSGLQFGDSPDVNTNDTKVTGDAMMARLNYTLLDRYLFTASIRRDGYSAFGQENPRATFPAAAFSWHLSEESFFDVDWVNHLALRLSWGVNGNRDIGAYSSMAQLGSNMYYDGSNIQMGVYTSTLQNPALRWEETESINIGLDVGLIENRVDLTLDYYESTTSNLLVNRTLPRTTGYQNVTTNIGELANRGFEMTVHTVNATSSDFMWRSNLNLSLNRNKIESLFGDMGTYTLLGEEHEGELPDFDNEWFPGYSIDAVWDYDIVGIWQMDEEAEADEYGLQPGDIKAVDVNGDGDFDEEIDKQFIGHTEPRFRIGFGNEVDYGNFSASVFIRSDLGHIRPFSHAIHESSTYDRRNVEPIPYWTEENESNEWPRLSQNHDVYGGGIMMYKDASFVRIQDVTLSYTLPSEITDWMQMQSLRVYGSIRNLYSFDSWPGWDPESGLTPMPRTFSLGLNLTI